MKEEALSPIPDPTLRLPVFASQGVSRTCNADHYNGDADNIMLIVVKVLWFLQLSLWQLSGGTVRYPPLW